MGFQAVVFDLDGTLLNTLDDIADSMNHALATLGFPGHDLPTYKILVGDGMDVLTRRALPEAHRDEKTVARGLEQMRAEYGRRWADKTTLYDGIPELLDALCGREIRLAVLSNKPHEFTHAVVKKLLPKWHFDPIYGARSGVPRKPDPAGAFQVAQDLKISPAECLYLGDTNTDMLTANAAGMYALGALWGFRPAEELLQSGAKALLEKPQDMLKHL